MPRKPKPPVTNYAISVQSARYGEPIIATVSPAPTGLFVVFRFGTEGMGQQPIVNGLATQPATWPAYQGGSVDCTAYVGDGSYTSAPLSNVASFTVAP